MENEFYRPVNIEFKVTPDESGMPEKLGNFETAEEASKYIGANFTCLNRQITVNRYMDAAEKSIKREEYRNILEDVLPVFEKDLIQAEIALTEAKKKQKNAEEAYKVTMNNAKQLAYEVKRVLQEMDLDEKYTYQIPFKGNYYYFTYIDKQIRLCKIQEIPEYEKADLWNQMAGNQEYIDRLISESEEKKTKKKA